MANELKPGDEGYIDPNGADGADKGGEGEGEDDEIEGDGKGKKDDKGDKKPAETPEARKARLDRQLEQHKKKHPELYPDDGNKKGKKSDDIDYGELAFLTSKGIESDDEVALAKEYMANTGKSLKDVVGNKFFNAEIKEMREAKATADATPSGSKRSGQSAQNTVDYWIKKGELPEDRDLRQKVVNERMNRETKKDVFKK